MADVDDSSLQVDLYDPNWLVWYRGATTAEKLRGPRFGFQHRGAFAPRQVKGRAGCWVRGDRSLLLWA